MENGNYQDPGLDGEELMKILCLYTVSFHLGGIMDKKLTTQLWDVRKKVSTSTLLSPLLEKLYLYSLLVLFRAHRLYCFHKNGYGIDHTKKHS